MRLGECRNRARAGISERGGELPLWARAPPESARGRVEARFAAQGRFGGRQQGRGLVGKGHDDRLDPDIPRTTGSAEKAVSISYPHGRSSLKARHLRPHFPSASLTLI